MRGIKTNYWSFTLTLLSVFLLSSCSSTRGLFQQPATNSSDPVWGRALLGLSIYDLDKDEYIYGFQENRRFIPASNTKLLTTYASLKYLPDSLPGWFVQDRGDTLLLRPNGDPTSFHTAFDQQRLLQFFAAVRKPVLLQYSAKVPFTALGRGWPWDALSGSSYSERSELPVFGYKHPAQRAAAASSYSLRADANGGAPPINVTLFADTLRKLSPGLKLDLLRVDSVDLKSYRPLYTQSRNEVLAPMMKNSDNFLAEQLLLMAGTATIGRLDDRETIKFLMDNDFKGFSDSPIWADGSGLSRYNLMSSRFFVELLREMERQFGWETMRSILPKGGEGTLKGLYEGYENHIFAKTGTLSSSVALSGYLYTKKGKKLAFSLLVNNHQSSAADTRKAIERYLTQIIDRY